MKGIHECSARPWWHYTRRGPTPLTPPTPPTHSIHFTHFIHFTHLTKALPGASLTPAGRKLEFTRDTQFQNQLKILSEWTTLVSVDSVPLFGVVIPAALCCLHEDGWRVHTGQS
ncbi:hypothetical protein E2C01_084952 [Portunus trituberculatus]|uniref:Uncharacterized protein n=1 Tax=Portunus trituberculatus TaxID=210409 RepID=A0A5B7J954_PORTR|nr:hypothetical protein [Portunus trituberculatus]